MMGVACMYASNGPGTLGFHTKVSGIPTWQLGAHFSIYLQVRKWNPTLSKTAQDVPDQRVGEEGLLGKTGAAGGRHDLGWPP